MASPFEADCERKAQGLRDFQDRRLRGKVCAECLVLREYHYDAGHRFRRMTDREWADYCGMPYEEPERYLRQGQQVHATCLVGMYRYELECGHVEDRLIRGDGPHPKTIDCNQCKKRNKSKMGFLNGKYKDRNGASAVTPAPAPIEPIADSRSDSNGNRNTALVPAPAPAGGGDLEIAIRRREILRQAAEILMIEGVDYGRAGGTKPTLLQPGADKLCVLFGIDIAYTEAIRVEDWTGADHAGEPFFYYKVDAIAYHGEQRIGQGTGSCNSWESKYRWRQAERVCPNCGKPNIRRAKDRNEWYCWAKTGGCGATFPGEDPKILEQQTGRKPNPDIYDQVNTVLKIAYKRCKVLTTINATSASEFFTQDVEDFATAPDDPIDTAGNRPGTREAAAFVAQHKIRTGEVQSKGFRWRNMGELKEAFKAMREGVGEVIWREELERWGWSSFNDVRNAIENKSPQAREKTAALFDALDARKGGI